MFIYSQSQTTAIQDNHILDMSMLLLQGKEEFYIKVFIPYIVYILIHNFILLLRCNQVISSEFLTNIFLIQLIIGAITTLLLRYGFKKSIQKLLVEKPYLLERSVFRLKPVFN